MTVTKTPNGFTLDSAGQRVVVDPITRIEGHMRAEVNIDDNNMITNAVSSGTMWRGLEVILKGRDPRDAWAFTQRICGVCTGTHALTSVRAVEDSLGIEIPENANSIRNIMQLSLQVHDHRGAVPLSIRVTAGRYEDDVVRRIQVVPPGFPMEHSFGGILEGVAQHEVTVPDSVIPGSLTTQVQVYPTPLASMAEALAAMLREPHGCFEQTSSVNYPNVMAMQYMQSHHGVDPAFVKKAAALLDRGYRKLVGFECKERGYEWFGGDPGHEALTAYGVLEFHDMAQVMNVDAEMVKRTRRWLLDRRDGEGGFKRNERALDTFGRAPALTTNAYILWALAEVGETGLEKELRAFKRAVRDSKDTYVLALAANVFHKTGDTEEAARLRKQLAGLQAKGGSLPGATTSITGSGGRSLVIETSALAVLAWLQGGEQTREIEAAMRWISAQCQGGRFGSTQATILALKAVIAYDKARAQVAKDGVLELLVDGEVRHTLPFQAGQKQALTLPDIGETLGTGTHKLALRMQGGGVMPYSMAVRFHAMTPASAEQAPLALTTQLATQKAVEGEPVEMRVEVRNVADKGRPMAVAIVGLPGGLEARAKQLEELVKEGKVDAIETRAREVILYWRSLAPKAHHTLTIDCVAAVPGRYEAPASRAYLYYTDEDKRWVAGTTLEITSR